VACSNTVYWHKGTTIHFYLVKPRRWAIPVVPSKVAFASVPFVFWHKLWGSFLPFFFQWVLRPATGNRNNCLYILWLIALPPSHPSHKLQLRSAPGSSKIGFFFPRNSSLSILSLIIWIICDVLFILEELLIPFNTFAEFEKIIKLCSESIFSPSL
jgi:hypothetical protein